MLQLNPSYKPGTAVPELVQRGILHPNCAQYFSKNGQPFRFHYRQEQVFITAQQQQRYVSPQVQALEKHDLCCPNL